MDRIANAELLADLDQVGHIGQRVLYQRTAARAAARIRELEREQEVLLRILRSGSRCRRDCTRQADWVIPERGSGAEAGHTWGNLYCDEHLPDNEREGAVKL